MTLYAAEACDESNGLWLPLTEYSVRSGVSTSTIRRKIKSNSIKYRVENGRYLILLESDTQSQPSLKIEPAIQSPVVPVAPTPSEKKMAGTESLAAIPMMEKAVEMVSEAFEHSLKEKDERIRLMEKENRALKERLDELKVLVQVLEEKYDVHY